MKNLSKAFPVLQQYVYLNTAASGLLSEKVLEFRQDHDLDYLISGSVFREKTAERLTQVREIVGGFFNCAPERVALVPNFSYGFNTLLEGIEKKKKVLLLRNDYPSINWAVTSRDFEVRYVEIDAYLEENIEKACKEDPPDFFAFSIVQYVNGVKLSIDFLKGLKEKFPEILFVADGTQYCGTERFDFDGSGIDVVIASCYKWLHAGYGNGFMLFNERASEKIAPKSSGFNSLQGKYKAHQGNFLGKFEPGHQDTLNFGSLGVALKGLDEVGMDLVEQRVARLGALAKEKFAELNLLEDLVEARSLHSSIFNIKGDDKLFSYLRAQNIIVSQRGGGIRVSFHYFNTEEELNRLLESVKKMM